MTIQKFKVNDQVIVKKQQLHGNVREIKVGNILSFADPDRKIAVVGISSENVRRNIPISELELVQDRFSRAVVTVNPVNRSIGSLFR
jgi:hypothetical protein